MNEDALVETMARWLQSEDIVNGATGTWKTEWNPGMVRSLLAALRAEGFEVYRPEECETVVWGPHIGENLPITGTYRLVPVGEGTDDE